MPWPVEEVREAMVDLGSGTKCSKARMQAKAGHRRSTSQAMPGNKVELQNHNNNPDSKLLKAWQWTNLFRSSQHEEHSECNRQLH